MTCAVSTAATLRARAEAAYDAHQAAVSRGDAAKGRVLWIQYRDVEFRAYLAEREVEREELMARYPECHD
jgi:hypothetical protein